MYVTDQHHVAATESSRNRHYIGWWLVLRASSVETRRKSTPQSAINPDTLIIQSIAYTLQLLSHPASHLQSKNSYDGYYHNLNSQYIILLRDMQISFDFPAVTNHMSQCTAWSGLFVHFKDGDIWMWRKSGTMIESKIPFLLLPSPAQIAYSHLELELRPQSKRALC